MLILGIESATPVASAALMDELGLLGEITLNVGLTHSEQLLPAIDSLLRQCRRDIHELTAIGVSAGPGSFTGLRIGMATAKAIAQGLSDIADAGDNASLGSRVAPHVFAIPTTEVMAWQLLGLPVLVSPMLNARRGQIYTALYRWCMVEAEPATGATALGDPQRGDPGAAYGGQSLDEVFAARQRGKKDRMLADAGDDGQTLECLVPPLAITAEAWAARLAETGESVYLLGDAVALYKEIWEGAMGSLAKLLPPIAGLCRGGVVAMATMDRLRRGAVNEDFYGMKPLYLRGI